jgi:hypothetical protein
MKHTVKELIDILRNGSEQLTLGEQGVLSLVFALGALIRNDPSADQFYQHTQGVAMKILAETTLESATFAFLLSLYQFTTGQISAAWTTFALVVRIAQALGYHRNVAHWNLSAYQEECRRRIWANIYCMDAYQSVIYGRPALIQEEDCDVDPPNTSLELLPGTTQFNSEPNQMLFHLEFYKLCRIMRQMMKQLYLCTKSDGSWEIIRDLTEKLEEFYILLPSHLQLPTTVLRNQAVFLNLLYNHMNMICVRPILTRANSDALTHRRWLYCRNIAQTASKAVAINMEEAQKCGHLARNIFSLSGLYLYACEVEALRAIASPRNSEDAIEGARNLNKFLEFFTHSSRPSPHTPQMMAIMKECIRVVKKISEEPEVEWDLDILTDVNENSMSTIWGSISDWIRWE